MEKFIISICCVFFFFFSFVAAGENKEIEFLLSFVANSECVFIRNGQEHQSLQASEHLAKKYNYAKSRIKTPEDFIAKIASRSSMSKKPYHVRCEEKELLAEQWFTDALISHRETGMD